MRRRIFFALEEKDMSGISFFVLQRLGKYSASSKIYVNYLPDKQLQYPPPPQEANDFCSKVFLGRGWAGWGRGGWPRRWWKTGACSAHSRNRRPEEGRMLPRRSATCQDPLGFGADQDARRLVRTEVNIYRTKTPPPPPTPPHWYCSPFHDGQFKSSRSLFAINCPFWIYAAYQHQFLFYLHSVFFIIFTFGPGAGGVFSPYTAYVHSAYIRAHARMCQC